MEELTYMFLGSPSVESDGQPEDAMLAASSRRSVDDGNSRAGDAGSSKAAQRTPETPKKRRGIRDFLSKANLQDQLLDK